MKIKEVQKITELSAANIRFYEKEGLIHPQREENNNYRQYNEEDVCRLEEIKKLRLLGISITKIKQLFDHQISLEDVLRERLVEVAEEQKNLELTKQVCENAIKNHIELSNITDLAVDEKKHEWQVRLAIIMKEDTYKEKLTKEQFHQQVTRLLAWGFFLCGILSVLLQRFAVCYTQIERNQVSFVGIGLPHISYRFISYMMYGIIFATVLIGIIICCSSNALLLLILFHVSLILNTLFLSICFYWKETIALLMIKSVPVIFFSLAVYIIAIGLLAQKHKKLLTKISHGILIWVIYTMIIGIALAIMNNFVFISLIPTIVAALFGLFAVIEWTFFYKDNKHFTKYNVYCLATNITNIVAFVISKKGSYGSMYNLRR